MNFTGMYIFRWKKHTNFKGLRPVNGKQKSKQISKPDYWQTLVWVNQGNSYKL